MWGRDAEERELQNFLPAHGRAVEGQQPSADDDCDPATQGDPADDPGGHRGVGTRRQGANLAEVSRVEDQDIQSRDAHEQHLEMEGRIVNVLVGLGGQE